MKLGSKKAHSPTGPADNIAWAEKCLDVLHFSFSLGSGLGDTWDGEVQIAGGRDVEASAQLEVAGRKAPSCLEKKRALKALILKDPLLQRRLG